MSGGSFGRIGPYELRGVLGRGGMAAVYRAYAPALRREVALKVLTAPEDKLALLRERFLREARVIRRLQHPNILALLDSGEENGIPYLAMELIERGSLNTRLGTPLPPREAIGIARQIGAALDYAHSQGVVHRDVKPANIFLRPDRAVLADFGIVKVFGELGPKLTQTGVGIGTPEYTAPEQALGEAIDGRADLYSLGIVLYEMLTGKPPYQGGTLDVVNAHVQGQLPDPRSRNPALPPAVGAVLKRALARRPQDRYASGAALADALEGAITGTRPVAVPPPAEPAAPPTMLLDRTRELLLQTREVPLADAPRPDATIVAPRPGAQPGPTSAPPSAPRALPPLPGRPTDPPAEPRAATGERAAPPPSLPSLPAVPRQQADIATLPPAEPPREDPTARRPLRGPDSRSFAPPNQTLPPLQPAPLPLAAPQAAASPLTPLPQRASDPPTAPPGIPATTPPPRAGRALWIGLAAAVLLLLALLGVGGVALLNRNRTIAPTATAVAAATPSAAPSAAVAASPTAPLASATPLASRAATATAAAASDPARAQIAAGDAALQEGKFTQAVESYKAALATNPESAIANRQLGLALWVWNHDPGEIGYLDRATRLDPNDPLAWAYLSFSSVDTHQVERAYSAAQRAVAADGSSPEAYAAIANCYLRYPPVPSDPDSGTREAREAIERAKALDPNNLWVLWVEHIVLFNEENYAGALVPLDRMIALRPNWATLYSAKGVLYHGWQRPADARTYLQQALAIDPAYPWALTELGWLAYEDADYAGARGYFGRALQLTDDVNDSAHVGLGYSLAAAGDYGNAIPHCQRAASIEPRGPSGFSCLGYLYRVGTKQYDESLAAYRKVLELRPYWETGHIGIALVQAAQGKLTDAEATLKKGLLEVREPREINYWLGWVLYQQGKYQEAQPNFETAVKLVPDRADFQYQLGQNLEQLARFPEARAAYERALAIDPGYTAAKSALDRLAQQGR